MNLYLRVGIYSVHFYLLLCGNKNLERQNISDSNTLSMLGLPQLCLMYKTSIFPISDLAFQIASYWYSNRSKLAIEIRIGNIKVLDISLKIQFQIFICGKNGEKNLKINSEKYPGFG